MNTDIRLLTSFKGHRKRIKLYRMLGPDAVLALIDLWLTIAQDAPDGDISKWTDEDIGIASGWAGDAAAYANALIACGWIERNEDGIFKIHDWQEHQIWASKAKQRSEAARVAAEYRWEKRRNVLKKCDRKATANANVKPAQSESIKSAMPLSFPFLSFPIPSFLDKNTLNDFCEMRKRIKKPLTEVAVPRLINKLTKLHKEGYDVNAILDESIQNSWQGVFPPKPDGNGKGKMNRTMELFARRERDRQEQEHTAEAGPPTGIGFNSSKAGQVLPN